MQVETAPTLASFRDSIYLNAKLFQRIKALYDHPDPALDPEQKALVNKYYSDFVKAGAQLSDADKTTLRGMNREESELSTAFQNKLLAATNAAALVISDSTELEGLSAADIAAAREAAQSRKLDGKWVLVLRNTTQQPLLASLRNRAVRERLLDASMTRAEQGGDNDTRATAQRLAELRAQKAKLLGFSTFADYQLDDQMAKTPAHALKLMNDMVPAATNKARGEVARMQQLIDEQNGSFKLAAWDWQFYAEQVRKAEYDLNESDVKPYFELDRVLKDGVFYAARPDVRPDLQGAEGHPALTSPTCGCSRCSTPTGRRWRSSMPTTSPGPARAAAPGKDTFVDQSGLRGTKPVAFNVANFTKPAPGQPALLSFDDVKTMFHEFGHALHAMFSNVKYPTLASTNVPRDFVEFPSQFNEHWALEPSVFANYAKHYQTGQPMPAELVDKIKKSRTFDQGYATTEYLAAALLDMGWHTLPATAPKQDVDSFETGAEALQGRSARGAAPLPHPYFAHIWGGGYSAGYYAYLWSEVLDHDAYYWFVEHGGMTRENGQRFRDMILSRGGTVDAATLYRAFRGRDPSVEPLLEQRGLKPGKN